MNPFLIEPYSCWNAKPAKKKHWHQIIEEEQLMARIIAEAQALAEAKSAQMTVNDSVQNGQTSAQTITNIAAGVGAGGVPPYAYWHPDLEVVDFSGVPATPYAGPVTITFTNLTTTQEGDNYYWDFGDGTTSTLANPAPHFYSNTGSYTVSLQATHSALGQATESVKTNYVSASVPVVAALFTMTSASRVAPLTVSFANTSTNTSYQPTSSYTWVFTVAGVVVATSQSVTTPTTLMLVNTGSATASLQHTGSYGITNVLTQYMTASTPTIVKTSFTVVTGSNLVAPVTGTFAVANTYDGHGVVTGSLKFGDGTSASYTGPALAVAHGYETSSVNGFTASLTVTESSFRITSDFGVLMFSASAPSIVIAITNSISGVTALGFTSSLSSSTTYLSSSTSPGTLTGLWSFGDTSSSAWVSDAWTTHVYVNETVNGFTASLSLTESKYSIKSNLATAMFSRSLA